MNDGIEWIKREHGGGIGVPADGMDTYGTRDPELQNIVNNLIKANGASDLDVLISRLPDEALIKIIERRYRNVANKLQDRHGLYKDVLQKLSKDITLDLNIIKTALKQKRNLFQKNINASNHIGQDNYQNIVGLLEEYQSELEQVMINIPLVDGMTDMPVINPTTNKQYQAYDFIEEIKEEARNIGAEIDPDAGEIKRK